MGSSMSKVKPGETDSNHLENERSTQSGNRYKNDNNNNNNNTFVQEDLNFEEIDGLEFPLSTVPYTIVVSDSRGFIIHINSAADVMFRYSNPSGEESLLIGLPVSVLIADEVIAARHASYIRAYSETGIAGSFMDNTRRVLVKFKDGNVRAFNASLSSIVAEGDERQYVMTFVPIRDAPGSIESNTLIIGASGRISQCSPTIDRLLDVRRVRQVVGVPLQTILEETGTGADVFEEALAKRESSIVDAQVGFFFVRFSIVPLRDRFLQFCGAIITFTDVTAITRRADVLAVQKEFILQSLQNLQHEVKNPLFAHFCKLKMVMERAEQQGVTPSMNDLIDLSASVRAATYVLDGAASLTQLHTATLQLTLTSFHLADVMDIAVRVAGQRVVEKNITITKEMDDLSTRMLLTSDEAKVFCVIRNFLDNATKFCSSSTGNPTIRLITNVKHVRGEHVLVLRVVNSCRQEEELTMAQIENIFQRHMQVDPYRNVPGGGSGLGLHITKNLTDVLNGTISANSGDEETEFTLEVPLIECVIPEGEGKVTAATNPEQQAIRIQEAQLERTRQLQAQRNEVQVREFAPKRKQPVRLDP